MARSRLVARTAAVAATLGAATWGCEQLLQHSALAWAIPGKLTASQSAVTAGLLPTELGVGQAPPTVDELPRHLSPAALMPLAAMAIASSLCRRKFPGILRRGVQGDQATAEQALAADSEDAETLGATRSSTLDSLLVQRLKDLVFIKEMRAAITSGEFALRLRGAERPGLVDYSELVYRLNGFIDRLDRQPPEEEVLPQDEAWKANRELKETRKRLEDRLVEMTRVQQQCEVEKTEAEAEVGKAKEAEPELSEAVEAEAEALGEAAKAQGAARRPPAAGEPSKILLYLRDDQTVDIDTALKESCSTAPFSSDLWERLRGNEHHEEDDWSQTPDVDIPPFQSPVKERRDRLEEAKHNLAALQARRQSELRKMGTDEDQEAKAKGTKELFRLDSLITGSRILVLLANMDLLYELVAEALERQLRQTSIKDWDLQGKGLKTLVFEFSLLDKQTAPYRELVTESADEVRQKGLDSDEIRMLEDYIARIADRLGIEVDCVGQEKSLFRPIRHQWSRVKTSLRKVKSGVLFYGNGTRLLYHDLHHAVKLLLKMAFLKYTLQPREVQTCYRAAKDFFVLIPFLIILLIPLTPPGHVLVFSLIMKVYPDFFPTPFTERRQNVMRIYDEIKPPSQRRNSWA